MTSPASEDAVRLLDSAYACTVAARTARFRAGLTSAPEVVLDAELEGVTHFARRITLAVRVRPSGWAADLFDQRGRGTARVLSFLRQRLQDAEARHPRRLYAPGAEFIHWPDDDRWSMVDGPVDPRAPRHEWDPLRGLDVVQWVTGVERVQRDPDGGTTFACRAALQGPTGAPGRVGVTRRDKRMNRNGNAGCPCRCGWAPTGACGAWPTRSIHPTPGDGAGLCSSSTTSAPR